MGYTAACWNRTDKRWLRPREKRVTELRLELLLLSFWVIYTLWLAIRSRFRLSYKNTTVVDRGSGLHSTCSEILVTHEGYLVY